MPRTMSGDAPRAIVEEFFLSGLQRYLLERPGVTDVSVQYGKPLSNAQITSWEHAHQLTIPGDVRQFYISHDGALLSWQYTYNKNPITIGRIVVNSLKELYTFSSLETTDHNIPSLEDASCEDWTPLSVGSLFVALSYCESCGYTGLAYKGGVFSGIWLIDLALSCHYLSASFSNYISLAQVHLGLIQWPYAVANVGLSSDTEVWFEIFIPHRLLIDYSSAEKEDHHYSDDDDDNIVFTKPNFAKFSTDGLVRSHQ